MKSNNRDDVIICRCEEISLGEIKEAINEGAGDVDGIKRLTTAGMGLCQGRTCGRLIAGIAARERCVDPGEVRLCRQRNPVRPVTAAVIANSDTGKL